jgi:hypothetical protein
MILHWPRRAVARQPRRRRRHYGDRAPAVRAAQFRGRRSNRFQCRLRPGPAQVRGSRRQGGGDPVARQRVHFQLGAIVRTKGFVLAAVTVKPLYSFDDMAKAVASGTVDAAMLPAHYARDPLTAGQCRLIGWVSEIDEQQLGALFASSKTIKDKRATVEKFVRAYCRGVADSAQALLRRDRYGKRVTDSVSQEAAGIIARYVFSRPLHRHGPHRGQCSLHGSEGAHRHGRHHVTDRLVKGARLRREECRSARRGRPEYRRAVIVRIAHLPASPPPETIL